MDTTLHANFARTTFPSLGGSPRDFVQLKQVRRTTKFLCSLSFGKRTKRARQRANIRVIDVPIVHERKDITTLLLSHNIRGFTYLIKIVTPRLQACDYVVQLIVSVHDGGDGGKNVA
jgi:hypothetical protein